MGYGDEIMATGMARGARGRGRRIAFGDGRRIIWGPHAEPMFRGNPNIAPPGSEGAPDLDWIAHHKGHRLYNTFNHQAQQWMWNYNFRPTPGQLFLSEAERQWASGWVQDPFLVIEPNVSRFKSVAPNKDWGLSKYRTLAHRLMAGGHTVVQFIYTGAEELGLPGVVRVTAPTFRHALGLLARARAYVGPEGGMHHGAAAGNVPGVVLFGGFIPPSVTGYTLHRNLTGGAEACGRVTPCQHCREAMSRITVDEVEAALAEVLECTGS